MKNPLNPTLFVILMSFAVSTATHAFSAIPLTAKIESSNDAEAQRLANRLIEIKAIDGSTMTRKQKKELKDEVKSIKHQLKTNANSGGVYISVGAAIIIILLLIILL